jgi:hypothetical protein
MTDACGFEGLSDADKVQFARAENAATLAYIDELLDELDDQTGGDCSSPAGDSSGPDPTYPARRQAPQPPAESS